ncbi:c-type cytochrome [Aestuariirhabdus litorea]|uniref:c-type cytochrome n=1 Tax=Aestuariirhabdus litorea TaxID=2528527 RepID=UPI0013E3FFA5|nr:c-type cytochrome [Aestuariirhabdus litorea]
MLRKLPPFWQALMLLAGCALALELAVYPLMPRSLMIQYLVILAVGMLLYYSADEARWQAFLSPLRTLLHSPRLLGLRRLLLVVVPLAGGVASFLLLDPVPQAPTELRQAHPAPPASFSAWGRRIEFEALDNPIRARFSDLWPTDPEGAMEIYSEAVAAGREIYFSNCVFCHGALLDGRGHLGLGLNPPPANFRDLGTIAQLEESYLFWRIATGGPGLPREGAPARSQMPAWHESLEEPQLWQTILYLYDAVGQEPRIWDPARSAVASAIRQRVETERRGLTGEPLYQLYCAACHGEEGLGDGVAADYLYPRPRDFGLGLYKYKSSPGALPPRDEDLLEVIAEGLPGTGMPAWRSLLSEQQIASLVPVLKGFDFVGTWAPADAPDEAFDEQGRYRGDRWLSITEREPVEGRVPYSEASVASGRAVYESACIECHGEQGRGNITSDKPLEDDWGYRVWPRDLTQPGSWRASEGTGSNPRDNTLERLYQRVSIGISGTPMPAHREVEEGNRDPLSLEDRWHVVNYVYSLRHADARLEPDGLLVGARVEESLPLSGDDPRWQQARPLALPLIPNLMQGERLYTPLNRSLVVRALFNEAEVAFLVEWHDRTESRPGSEVAERLQDASLTLYADAVALQFPQNSPASALSRVDLPLLQHGDPGRRSRIWYWNAGQLDPPMPSRLTPLNGRGGQKPKPAAGEDPTLSAQGRWEAGRWQWVVRRSRESLQPGAVSFESERYLPFALATWDGSNGEIGSRHSLTGWHRLWLPEPVSAAYRLVASGAVALGLLLLGWILFARPNRP